MDNSKVVYLAGKQLKSVKPRVPFDETVCDFLEELSKALLHDKECKTYSDLVSFAFWIRKAGIEQQKKYWENDLRRLGRGCAFHIAPSNVPINAGFTFVFGLLAGNNNIVRVSTKNFRQVALLAEKIQELFSQEKYRELGEENAIVSYEHDKEVTDAFSRVADVRIIWGGDQTIEEIRKSPLKVSGKEIVFSDRYSFGILDASYILRLSEPEICQLAKDFYNDTYLMDQNACSAPHMLLWRTEGNGQTKKAQERFWDAVAKEAVRYELEDIKVSDKYTLACKTGALGEIKGHLKQYENLLYVVDVERLPAHGVMPRGSYGLFYQCNISDWKEIVPWVHEKMQTVAVAGVEPEEIRQVVYQNRLTGIDRVVPFGKTLDIGLIWDGYDLIREMSRRMM
jgi:hypothetical protein